ncbi:sulfatase-like hydrolase/transferase [Bernardetia sp. ABR2-2B]|uniref:LTA synthase family protein n=1 Tax=Bernardetia sp. ABR2-2B TaxID=3127472 RepID=UPI0030D1690F
MNTNKRLPVLIQFFKLYTIVLLFFSAFRVMLFFTELDRIDSTVPFQDILSSFFMGLRFDIVIASYILILPYFILAVASLFKKEYKIIHRIVFYFIVFLFIIAFLICAVDIPYFNQFFARFSITAFEWFDSPVFVLKMVAQEPRYWSILIPFLILMYIFIRLVKKVFSSFSYTSNDNVYLKIGVYIFFLAVIFLGIRGRLEHKSPIRVGTAYFSNNAFLNQLGLNPNFTLIRSYLDSKKAENKSIQLMDNKVAISNVQSYFDIENPNKEKPLARNITFDSTLNQKYNVVLVIMESMSAAKMQRHGNEKNLTPFLDSISNKGYYFDNTYTAGIHTMNGIFSTLTSYPSLFRQHPMKETIMPQYSGGIYPTLLEKGYSTIYFTTHDGQFDNVEGFLKANTCERVVSKPDYPAEEVKTTLGVPDDVMFDFSLPILDDLSKKEKPFFATLMTTSDHGPYYIPDYFTPKSEDIKDQIVEYADYSLRKFITQASKKDWFENTLFVFVADHGTPIDGLYDMSIDYNHSPLLFYAPNFITEHKTFDKIAGQIDVFPSIMGLLKLPYQNNTLGIDLFSKERPYIYFNADDKYGVMDNEWFLIVRAEDNVKSLFKYKQKDTKNYASENKDIVEKMDEYAKSNMQSFQYIKNNNGL